jgi:tripartite-type tricarboxylate transporter receptor subunit TctC
MVHVPYRGTRLALTDLQGGQVQVMFDNLASSKGTLGPASYGHWR